jgi:aminoglycoside phosphotransferase (APT) family kinase protein
VLRQNPVLVQGMNSLHSIWREETLIHGDIKWDNFVLLGSAEQSPEPELRVVDWELADIGDSSWDVGCAFCCYVQHWLATMSADSSHEDTDTLIAKAPIHLEETWPAIRALWDAYSVARGFSVNESQLEMRRAAAFAAARLVLTAFEITVRAPQITRTTQLCLQLAAAMMTAPEIALRDILGLQEGVNA